jgi:hypothetical protein
VGRKKKDTRYFTEETEAAIIATSSYHASGWNHVSTGKKFWGKKRQ